jgi:hypothetical protein
MMVMPVGPEKCFGKQPMIQAAKAAQPSRPVGAMSSLFGTQTNSAYAGVFLFRWSLSMLYIFAIDSAQEVMVA